MRERNRVMLVELAVLLGVLLSLGFANAQVTTETISGTVKDSTGSVVPGAIVTVINSDTNVSRTLTTHDSGFYSAEAIAAGTYSVRITEGGFREEVAIGIHIDPGQRRAENVDLQIGSTSSEVNVSADAVQVNTETAETGAR